jgi:polysaccharide biosynthesis protein PslH
MNILFVSAVLPYPLHSGGQIRIYNLIKELSKKHTITLCSFIRNDNERRYVKELHFLHNITMVMRGRGLQPKYVVRSIFGQYPILLSTYDNLEMKSTVSRELTKNKYDLIHIEPFYVYPSLPQTSLPLVISEHNVEFEVYQSHASTMRFPFLKQIQAWDAEKLRYWEKKILHFSSHITAVSENDEKQLSSMIKDKPISIVPNGVDSEYFSFEKKSFDSKKQSFVFVGNFLWMPNRDVLHSLLEKIWPVVKASFPSAELHIVGGNVPDWAKRQATDGVLFDGVVPDIRVVYKNADALIAPLSISGGTKFKILEAMAVGCPVITTREGIYGLSGNIDKCVKIASTPGEIVSALSHMQAHKDQWQAMCINARNFVESQYSWSVIAEKLESIWKGVVS